MKILIDIEETKEILKKLEGLRNFMKDEGNEEAKDLLNGAIEMVKKAEKKM
jgi:hypothetical protein